MKLAIIGSETCFRPKQVKEILFKIKQNFGKGCTIITGGNKSGIEYEVKKCCMLFELEYQEFNPSFTGWNVYSALSRDYYTKRKHFSHYSHRYDMMLRLGIDRIIIGEQLDAKDWKMYESIKKKCEKKQIKVIMI